MGDLGPIEEDVRFDHGAADRLVSSANAAASSISGQQGSRASLVTTAMSDFAGAFSRVFQDNADAARADAEELVGRLREVARFAGTLAEEARSEQHRREVAREWQREQDDRGFLEKGADAVSSLWSDEEKPPVGPMPTPSDLAAAPRPPGVRQTPDPGAGGGGSGLSSARPEDLRSFANGSRGADSLLSGYPTRCRSAYDDFVAGCGWGRLDAAGVMAGFDRWLEANQEDVRWATTVAGAFAAAGGEGAVSSLSDSGLAAALRSAGVDLSRQDLQIDPPSAWGNPPTSGYADDPVNAATGNFIENEADLVFTGGCGNLALTRTYNSFDTGTGGFGPGWSSWTETGLTLTDDSARMRLPDGRVVTFPRLGEGWDRARGEDLWLERVGDTLVASTNDGTRWVHGFDGRLRERTRGPGTGVRLAHAEADGDVRLVRLEHERGRGIDLTWESGRVATATTDDGRTATYAYDETGRLTAVTTAAGTRTYLWGADDQGPDSGLLVAVRDADGVVEAENAYDERRRVSRQRSQHGRTSRFVYLAGNVTVVSDEDGTRSNTWVSDQRGRVIGIVDAEERRQSTSYDGRGNPVAITERDGSLTVHEHDARGRRVRTVTPTGAELTYGYDADDRVTTVVTESGSTTEYAYEGSDRNPSLLVDPEGGRTAYDWRDGLLVRVTDPTGVVLRMGYDDHGDLLTTTDAQGRVARLVRDDAGRVVAALSPGGQRTTFTFGPDGFLASRRDADGATWRFEHSPAGRRTAVVDPTGARTEVEHGSHGEEARTIDPLGRAITRQLDDLGNLAAAELPDGSRWEFTHDALSRLVATTDPSGGVWAREHDVTGAPVATVDPTGVRRAVETDRAAGTVTVDDGSASVATRFDPLGRVAGEVQPDGSVAMATYDRCGRPVELLDAEGALTRVERDAAGRPVRIVSPTGAVTLREHDVCGRLAAVVDPTGARTTIEYDVEGRVAAQVLPTGERAWVERDAVGRVTASHQPGRGTARYAYDAAGRVRQSSDTWHGQRSFRHDAAGQLVEVVNGNGGVTRWTYDANGRAVAITDPLGQVTRREFDAMNHCVAETDPLGRTTRAGYDAAGRQVWQTDPDGRRTDWAFDAHGRLASTSVDGRVVTSISRDLRARRVVLTDRTRVDGATVHHELEWDRRGRLVSRTRDGRGVSWTYDADGVRATMTTPDGSTTSYERDAAGRLTGVDHPLLGRAVLERDAAGRVVSAGAGGTISTWEHVDGHVASHTVTDSTGSTRTEIARDDLGRVTGLDRDGARTAFEHDQAHQLIGLRTDEGETRWRYDAAGRLVSETRSGPAGTTTRESAYDAAGQLLSTTTTSGATDGTATGSVVTRTRHAYDGAGRRVRTELGDGGVRDFTWGRTGHLASVTDRTADGEQSRRVELHVDARGELAELDGAELFWDSARGYAPSLVQAGEAPVVGAGPVTGIGSNPETAWSAAGWRQARSSGAEPWEVVAGGLADLPDGAGVGPSGELVLPDWTGGMEWLGARVYDPDSRGFLSVDPLDPVLGSGWSGNPYAYAGNDPLHALDPTGLKPLTDADLDAYVAAHQAPLGGVVDFVKENWEYVAAGAMVIGGAALMFAPVPGAQLLGAGLISAGVDTAIQKATTGEVNWGQVAISGAAGMVGGGAGALAARAGATAGRVALTEGVVEGVVSGGGNYLNGPGPHTPGGLLRSAAVDGATGVLPGPPLGDDLTRAAGRNLGDVQPQPLMNSFLDNGATVHHTPTATAIGDDPATLTNLSRSQGANGRHDVIVHGTPEGDPVVNGMVTHPNQIADAIRSNPAYQGQPINLVMCHGARGAAGDLSGLLGVDVVASPHAVQLHPVTGELLSRGPLR